MNIALVIGLGVVVFGVFGLMAAGAYNIINPTRTASDRLREMSEGNKVETFELITVGGSGESEGLVSRIGKLASPQSAEEQQKLRRLMIQAGYRGRRAPDAFNMIRVTAALALPILSVGIAFALPLTYMAAIVFGLAAVGYYVPLLILNNQATKRRADLLRSFPDCLDLLVSSVEAGLGLDAAFRRVSTEMETAAPELAREFQLVNYEIGAGRTRTEALKNLEVRTGLDEVRSLVNMLTQAERFGTSIAKSLRVHARATRAKRMSKAEEEAGTISPKLTVVMIIFLLPVLISLLVAPAGIQVMNLMANR